MMPVLNSPQTCDSAHSQSNSPSCSLVPNLSMVKNTLFSFLDFLQLAGLPFALQSQHEMILYSAVLWQHYWLGEITVIFLPMPHWMNAGKVNPFT